MVRLGSVAILSFLLTALGTLLPDSKPGESSPPILDGIEITFSRPGVVLPCPCSKHYPFGDGRVRIHAVADTDVPLNYKYSVTGGRIIGDGPDVVWDFNDGFAPREYSLTLDVDDGIGKYQRSVTKTISVVEPDCDCPCECPSIIVFSRNSQIRRGDKLDFEAKLQGGQAAKIGYQWNVTNGEIKSGQGTPIIQVVAKPTRAATEVTANLEVALDVDCGCYKTATESVPIAEETKFRPLPPDLRLSLDETRLLLECKIGDPLLSESRKSEDEIIQVVSGSRRDAENDNLKFAYSVTGGSILGTGSKVRWDLTGVSPGTYTITATIANGQGSFEKLQRTVTIAERDCPDMIDCPSFSLAPPRRLGTSDDYVINANVDSRGWDEVAYSWKVNGGTIVAGQGTKSVRVRAKWSSSDPVPYVNFSVLIPDKFRRYCQAGDSVFLNSPSPQ
jgi:hypothetical protein